MRVRRLEIQNFRGISDGCVTFQRHTLLVGGNNVGKSTVCEALELALGPERLYQRPIIDEHDFHRGAYLGDDDQPKEIQIRVLLTDLSPEQERRFGHHLRRWNDEQLCFVDDWQGGAQHPDQNGTTWALPIMFIGRYDIEEDDFVGGTFFDHPKPRHEEIDEETSLSLGEGRASFTRAHKRLCGFIFLRALRTGSRALSLQRGSLLDTVLRLSSEGSAEMWKDTLKTLRELDPAIGEIEQLKHIRNEIRSRLAKFVNLTQGDESTAFFASELTRKHLREVIRLFIATEPSNHSVPFTRQGNGSVNLLVFALLTLIAELKGHHSVIFVMEEPEIALPPHTQRRVTRYVLQEMGQSIVTSHSPYVIEQFAPEDVVILSRAADHCSSILIDTKTIPAKKYRAQRRQFAEAILSRAVFVLEGQTEMVAISAVSSALEQFRTEYLHIDLAGVTLFNAESDRAVPGYGPIFKSLGKRVYGMRDRLTSPDAANAEENIKAFDDFWQLRYKGIEELLVNEIPPEVLRIFLEKVSKREDYPTNISRLDENATDKQVRDTAFKVLKDRKGDSHGFGYAQILIEQCTREDELPQSLCRALLKINSHLHEYEYAFPTVTDYPVIPRN